MKKSRFALLLMTTMIPIAMSASIDDIISGHLKQYSQLEHFSAIAVSVKAGDKLNNYAAGQRAFEGKEPITATDLFDIGSITKSFTAALAIMAEREGKIKLDDKLGSHLPAYPQWGDISLTGLLDMSTGIPNYSDSPTMNYLISKDIRHYWSQTDLVNLVYPKNMNPPRKPGYFYSNTGYVLMDMILSDLYKKPFKQLLMDKIIKPLALKNTFYPLPKYSSTELQHLVRGYSWNIYDNPELLGQDVTENSMSWTAAAGGIIASSEDVLHWVEDLFISERLLTSAEKNKMQQMVSLDTGKRIAGTDKNDSRGFGLGIAQIYDEKIGHFWFYEGQTLGYRALYMYVPCNNVIVVAIVNSATNHDNDHAGKLVQDIYQQTLLQDSTLNCKLERNAVE